MPAPARKRIQPLDFQALLYCILASLTSALLGSALGAGESATLLLALLGPVLSTLIQHPGPQRRRRLALAVAILALVHLCNAALARVLGRPVSRRAAGWGRALRVSGLTACLAFLISIVALTAPELVLGDALVADRRLTLFHVSDLSPASGATARRTPTPTATRTPKPTPVANPEDDRRQRPRRERTPAPAPPPIDPPGLAPDKAGPLELRRPDRTRGEQSRREKGETPRPRAPMPTAVPAPNARDDAAPPKPPALAPTPSTVPPRDTPAPSPEPPRDAPVPSPGPPRDAPPPPRPPDRPLPDRTPPVFTGPRTIIADTREPHGTPVAYPLPPAADDQDPRPLVSCAPATVAAGTREPVGCTAGDRAGNSTQATFIVWVRTHVRATPADQ